MAHIDLAQGTGGLRPPLRDGQGSLDIQQLPWTVDRGSRQVGTSLRSAVDRTHSRQCLASSTPTKDEGGRLTTDNVSRAPLQESGPWTVLTTDNIARAPLQPKNRQVRLVYKRSNSAGKLHFLHFLGTLGAASGRQSRLSMSLQQQEIGLEA